MITQNYLVSNRDTIPGITPDEFTPEIAAALGDHLQRHLVPFTSLGKTADSQWPSLANHVLANTEAIGKAKKMSKPKALDATGINSAFGGIFIA